MIVSVDSMTAFGIDNIFFFFFNISEKNSENDLSFCKCGFCDVAANSSAPSYHAFILCVYFLLSRFFVVVRIYRLVTTYNIILTQVYVLPFFISLSIGIFFFC